MVCARACVVLCCVCPFLLELLLELFLNSCLNFCLNSCLNNSCLNNSCLNFCFTLLLYFVIADTILPLPISLHGLALYACLGSNNAWRRSTTRTNAAKRWMQTAVKQNLDQAVFAKLQKTLLTRGSANTFRRELNKNCTPFSGPCKM